MGRKVVAVIRVSFQDADVAKLEHLEGLIRTIGQVGDIADCVLAVADDAAHVALGSAWGGARVFRGHPANMTRRLRDAATAHGADVVVDFSLLTQCSDPLLLSALVQRHLASGKPYTRPFLWYPEYLPKVVDAALLHGLAEDCPWPYYAAIAAQDEHRFEPSVERLTQQLNHVDPLCRAVAVEQSLALRKDLRLFMASYDPEEWLRRCGMLLEKMDAVLKRRDVAVLEVGCGKRFGVGPMLHLFGVREYMGIDLYLSEVSDTHVELLNRFLALREARAPMPGFRDQPLERDGEQSFFQGRVRRALMSACGLSLPDESYDLIFSDAVLEHIDDLEKALAEMRRVLKPGGFMFHKVDFQDHTAEGDSHLYMSREAWRAGKRGVYINLLRPGDLYRMVRHAGLSVLELQETKNLNVRLERVHPDYLEHGTSDARTISCSMVLQKPE